MHVLSHIFPHNGIKGFLYIPDNFANIYNKCCASRDISFPYLIKLWADKNSKSPITPYNNPPSDMQIDLLHQLLYYDTIAGVVAE